jgi:peptidoglycan hydrolase-like protein with peptidoglycan-binding domain
MLTRLAALGFRNRGVFTSVNSSGTDTFGIIRLTQMPAVLLEVAFINNPQDMARLDVNTAARAIAEGIRQSYPISGGGGTGTGNFPPYPGVVLREGLRGESVRQAQQCINRFSAGENAIGRLGEDGIFGPRTRCVVMTFQCLNGLNPDGLIGPATWAALARQCG